MKYIFRKDQTVILSKSVDGKQDYWKHVVFVAWKDKKFQKTSQVIQSSAIFLRVCFLSLNDSIC